MTDMLVIMTTASKENVALGIRSFYLGDMAKDRLIEEPELAALAKRLREATGKSRAEAARELGVARPTLIQAEDEPERSLTKLRIRKIEAYSNQRVSGPLFRLSSV